MGILGAVIHGKTTQGRLIPYTGVYWALLRVLFGLGWLGWYMDMNAVATWIGSLFSLLYLLGALLAPIYFIIYLSAFLVWILQVLEVLCNHYCGAKRTKQNHDSDIVGLGSSVSKGLAAYITGRVLFSLHHQDLCVLLFQNKVLSVSVNHLRYGQSFIICSGFPGELIVLFHPGCFASP